MADHLEDRLQGLKPFGGTETENFEAFMFTFECLAASKDLDLFLTTKKGEHGCTSDAAVKRSTKLFYILGTKVTGKALQIVMEERATKCAAAALERLTNFYASSKPGRVRKLHQQLFNVRWEGSLTKLREKVVSLDRALEAIGGSAVINKEVIFNIVSGQLPPQIYGTILAKQIDHPPASVGAFFDELEIWESTLDADMVKKLSKASYKDTESSAAFSASGRPPPRGRNRKYPRPTGPRPTGPRPTGPRTTGPRPAHNGNPRRFNSTSKTVLCENCERHGHLSYQCSLPKVVCAGCNRRGHLFKFCRSSSRPADRERAGVRLTTATSTASNTSSAFVARETQPVDATLHFPTSDEETSREMFFVMDSGATTHIVDREDILTDRVPWKERVIQLEDDRPLYTTCKGTMTLQVTDIDGFPDKITLTDVLCCPQAKDRNVISAHRIMLSNGPDQPVQNHVMQDVEPPRIHYRNGLVVPLVRKGYSDLLPGTVVHNNIRDNAKGLVANNEQNTSTTEETTTTSSPSTPEQSTTEEKTTTTSSTPEPPTTEETTARTDSVQFYHERLGHLNLTDMRRLQHRFTNLVIPKDYELDCEECNINKSRRQPISKETADYTEPAPGDLIVADISGPHPTSLMGNKYTLKFTDVATRWKFVMPMSSKAAVVSTTAKFLREARTNPEGSLHVGVNTCIQTDSEALFTNGSWLDLLSQAGIKSRRSPPYSQAMNGIAEREWQTLRNSAVTMLDTAELPVELWDVAVTHATWILNRVPSTALNHESPYERLMGQPPDFSKLKRFGCKAYVHLDANKRTKWTPRAVTGIYAGTCDWNGAYKVFLPKFNELRTAYHVKFTENAMIKLTKPSAGAKTSPQLTDTDITNLDNNDNNTATSGTDTAPLTSTNNTASSGQETVIVDDTASSGQENGDNDSTGSDDPVYKIERVIDMKGTGENKQWLLKWEGYDQSDATWRKVSELKKELTPDVIDLMKTSYEQDYIAPAAYLGATIPGTEPTTVAEALSSDEKQYWQEAIDDELASLERNNTWEVTTDLPPNIRILKSRFVFKHKWENGEMTRHKARLVCKGFTQRPNVDYDLTYSPVPTTTTIRTVLALSATRGYTLAQADIKTAFLYGELDEERELFMELPPGIRMDKSGHSPIVRLRKSIYGLKQAPLKWNERLARHMATLGFTRSLTDPCLFTKPDLIIVNWVDDLILAAENQGVIDAFLTDLQTEFEISKSGPLTWILGMRVHTHTTGDVTLDQSQYTNDVLKRFGMEQCKPVSTPLPVSVHYSSKLDIPDDYVPPFHYRSVLGALMHLTAYTRPDITYAVRVLSRYAESPAPQHYQGLKHILRYLQGTSTLTMTYQHDANSEVIGYTDASFAECVDTRRSTTGVTFVLAGAAISWISKLERTVCLSSTEAEYTALSRGVREAQFLLNLLTDLGEQQPSLIINIDSIPAKYLAESFVTNQRTKHIEVKLHHIRQAIQRGIIYLNRVGTGDQLADCLTKAMSKEKNAFFRTRLGLR